jgi:hypothetical protein
MSKNNGGKTMMILGISGEKRVGKTTVSDYLVTNYDFKKLSFARPLKDMLQKIFNWTSEHTDGALKNDIDPVYKFTPRAAMQRFGTEFIRGLNPDFWLDRMDEQLTHTNNHLIVIDDVRFNNEAEYIRNMGGIIIKLAPKDFPWDFKDSHSSESGITLYNYRDYFVENKFSCFQRTIANVIDILKYNLFI